MKKNHSESKQKYSIEIKYEKEKVKLNRIFVRPKAPQKGSPNMEKGRAKKQQNHSTTISETENKSNQNANSSLGV